jgi:NhaP-type Na+/H+ or K+/H+ antiporter
MDPQTLDNLLTLSIVFCSFAVGSFFMVAGIIAVFHVRKVIELLFQKPNTTKD